MLLPWFTQVEQQPIPKRPLHPHRRKTNHLQTFLSPMSQPNSINPISPLHHGRPHWNIYIPPSRYFRPNSNRQLTRKEQMIDGSSTNQRVSRDEELVSKRHVGFERYVDNPSDIPLHEKELVCDICTPVSKFLVPPLSSTHHLEDVCKPTTPAKLSKMIILPGINGYRSARKNYFGRKVNCNGFHLLVVDILPPQSTFTPHQPYCTGNSTTLKKLEKKE
ncbi:hypothetical protein LXL04_033254 [Taraxacum kok-saghyz]